MESDIIRGDGTEPARPMVIDFDDGLGAQAYAVVLDHEVHSGTYKHVVDEEQLRPRGLGFLNPFGN